MDLFIEERASDSAFVERIWHARSEHVEAFTSIATSYWELTVWTQAGQTHLSIRGPETRPTSAPVPEDADFFGIVFKHGAFMPDLPVGSLVDNEIRLPEVSHQAFWLDRAAWEFPTYENAETFVNRLVRAELLVRDPLVTDALYRHALDVSLRTIQRRVLRATGLTSNAIYQIDRTRQATIMLREGASILDTTYDLGYADQPHLTRSLKRFIGQTPAELRDQTRPERLSLLFKTTPPG